MPNEDTVKGIMKLTQELGDINLQDVRDGLEMWRLHRQTEHAIESDLANWGLTPRQVEILEALYHSPSGSITPAELSDEVCLTRSAMTSALDSLEQLNHIARSPHPRDRRMVTVSLTPSGREFIAERLPERYARIAGVMSHLSPQERQIMIHVYTVLLEVAIKDTQENPE